MWERHGITEEQASEAVADVEALWFDPNPSSRSGRSLRVIGYSYSRRRVLTIILVRSETGRWYWVQTAGKLIVRQTSLCKEYLWASRMKFNPSNKSPKQPETSPCQMR